MTVKRLALVTLLVTYILIVFGGYVASSGSGMGCGPDWPLCNGVLIPSLHGATLVEYGHRVIGAILAILTIFLLNGILRSNPSPGARAAAYWTIALLALQVALGAIVVVVDLPAIVITVHLLVAMVFLAVLIFLWRTPQSADQPQPARRSADSGRQTALLSHINAILALLLLTIAFGAYIKHQGYGLACGWLDCRDSLLPVSGAQLLQSLHRALAAATAVYILLIACLAFAKHRDPGVRMRFLLAAITVLAQALIGVITVLTNIGLLSAVIHLAVATALFGIVVETQVFVKNRTLCEPVTT